MRYHTISIGVDVDGDNREHKSIWYQVYEDRTAFVFYANGCSLRECVKVSGAAWDYICRMPELAGDAGPDVREAVWTLLRSGTLEHYAGDQDNIVGVARLVGSDKRMIVERMRTGAYTYARSADVYDLWLQYRDLEDEWDVCTEHPRDILLPRRGA